MGACGCADNAPDEIYRIGRGKYIAVASYHGCDYCDTGIGYDIRFFNEEGRKLWAHGLKSKPILFDEDGVYDSGLMLGCVGLRELKEGAKTLIAEKRIGNKFTGYRNVADWLDDNGLELLQAAFRFHLKEIQGERERQAKHAAMVSAPTKTALLEGQMNESEATK